LYNSLKLGTSANLNPKELKLQPIVRLNIASLKHFLLINQLNTDTFELMQKNRITMIMKSLIVRFIALR